MNEDFPLRVLLVEDEAELAEEITGELKAHWLDVNVAETAAEAITFSRREKFDCIVVDYKLLSGTGEDVIKAIRQDRKSPNYNTPIILASGNLTKEALLKLRKLADVIIAKPYKLSELLNKILELCEVKKNLSLKSILFVEDELALAEEVIEELQDEGISVTHVISADAAFMQSKNHAFNCMIVDINLALGTGDQFIQRVRNDSNNPNQKTPIIIASSQISKPLLKKISHHVQGAVVKPYYIRDLFGKVMPFLSDLDD